MTAASAAFNAGDPAGCSDGAGATLEFDQRGSGFRRKFGPACDQGAFEVFVPAVFANGFEGP